MIDKTEIEIRALKVRQENSIQTYGVKDIFCLIEQLNIYSLRYPFGKDVLLGFSTVYEGKKVIVSNSSEILSREIFTICHELGHIIYDFADDDQDLIVDIDINEINKDISEERAFYFANCFLMPENRLSDFIKFELKKYNNKLTALDIVRIQMEFNVSYNAAVMRLHEIGFLTLKHKSELFDEKLQISSAALFRMIDADDKLLKPSNVIKVPAQFYEFVISNYNNDYIPFSSLKYALDLLGEDASPLKKEAIENNERLNIDSIFKEYE